MRKDVSIKFDEEVLRAIDKECKLYGCSRSNYVNVIMRGILNVPYEKEWIDEPDTIRNELEDIGYCDSHYKQQRSAKRDSTEGRSEK